MYTQFSHFVDILYYLCGEIEEINGVIENYNHKGLIEFEDTGFFNFKLKNGGIGSFNYTTFINKIEDQLPYLVKMGQ